ncbi:hypothetical protein OK074_8750 [Actinobacteria bacterium OK074]|nr:hypothetical protein OK074_8750 [Actinobacteria bacterium OK074]
MATVTPTTPTWGYTLHLPRDPRSPGVGRATTRAVLAAHGIAELADVAELVGTELLTNAHLHTRGEYALKLRSREPGQLTVAVWDNDPRVPFGFREGESLAAPADGAEGGRGLQVVRACAESWGVSVMRQWGASWGGKVLWVDCQWRGLR